MSETEWTVAGYDCETTGTNVATDRIVSAALVRRAADGRTETHTWLIDPGIDIPPAATAIHHITTEQVRDHGADPAQALDDIAQSLVAGLAAGIPLVIYNASFDVRILDAELNRHGLSPLAQRLGKAVAPIIDPLVIDREADRYRKGPRTLTDLMRVYKVPVSGRAHDATGDVLNTLALFDALARRHAILPTDPYELHHWQVAAHRKWATHYNGWLTGQGRAPSANPVWP